MWRCWRTSHFPIHTVVKDSQHLIQTWPSRPLQPQARSAGWWLLHCCPHRGRPFTPGGNESNIHSTDKCCVCRRETLTVQFSCLVHTHWNISSFFEMILTLRSLPSPLPTPYVKAENDKHIKHNKGLFNLLVFWDSPAMEWIRMLLIPSLFGGGSCLLNVFFIIS